jgi:uncharacterized membrane protein
MRRIWNTMLKGLVALLPLGLTIYVVYWLVVGADRFFSRALKALLPDSLYWPGLGLLTALLTLYLAGLAVNAYVVRRALRVSDSLFARVPVVKTIYVATRDFMRFFPASGQASDLKRVVMVPFGPGHLIGFVTAESGQALGLGPESADSVAVYLPMSYMIGGYTVVVPREMLVPTKLSVEAGMRIALMGGVQGGAPPVGTPQPQRGA